MDAYQSLANEYLALKNALLVKLDEEVPSLRGEERRAAVRRVGNEIDEADEILDQLELEAKGKGKMMVQVRAYRTEVKAWKAKVSQLSRQTDRDLLLSGSSTSHSSSPYGLNVTEDSADDDYSSQTQRQRDRLLQSTAVLSGSTGRLDNAQRLAAESEEIGQSVLSGLVGQRHQLVHANEQSEEADLNVGRAGRTIGQMRRLASRQKITIWLFAVVLLTLIVLILYNKFR
ncbi:hypothetical protein JCM8547_006132 [Rhodosporidiobolus lusitaniae]